MRCALLRLLLGFAIVAMLTAPSLAKADASCSAPMGSAKWLLIVAIDARGSPLGQAHDVQSGLVDEVREMVKSPDPSVDIVVAFAPDKSIRMSKDFWNEYLKDTSDEVRYFYLQAVDGAARRVVDLKWSFASSALSFPPFMEDKSRLPELLVKRPSAGTLPAFVNYAMDQFCNAQHVALVLAGHGTANLSVAEEPIEPAVVDADPALAVWVPPIPNYLLEVALGSIRHRERIELFGADACQLANLEFASTVVSALPGAIFVGSILDEPPSAWNWNGALEEFRTARKSDDGTAQELATAIVKTYENSSLAAFAPATIVELRRLLDAAAPSFEKRADVVSQKCTRPVAKSRSGIRDIGCVLMYVGGDPNGFFLPRAASPLRAGGTASPDLVAFMSVYAPTPEDIRPGASDGYCGTPIQAFVRANQGWTAEIRRLQKCKTAPPL